MSAKRYPDEFKIEAVKQVTDRGHSVADVAIGKSILSCVTWG
jgi:transposase